jgi:hypothetical protein
MRCNRRVQWYEDEKVDAQLDAAAACCKPPVPVVDIVDGRCDTPRKLPLLSSAVVSSVRSEMIVVPLQVSVLLALSLFTLLLLKG